MQITFYKIPFGKDIKNYIINYNIINQFKKYLNNLLFFSNCPEDNNNNKDNKDNISIYFIKINDIIPINQTFFLIESLSLIIIQRIYPKLKMI